MTRRYHHAPISERQLSSAVGEFRTWDDQNKRGNIQSIEGLVYRIAECIHPNTGPAYLASPYNHPNPEVRAERRKMVCEKAMELLRQGIPVISPIAHNLALVDACGAETGWDNWKMQDTAILSVCRKLMVLMLDGWRESVGVANEILYARENGIPIEYLVP